MRTHSRTAACGTLVALAAATLLSAQSAAGSSAPTRGVDVKTGRVEALRATTSPTTIAPPRSSTLPDPVSRPLAKADAVDAAPRTSTRAAGDCQALGVDLTPTNDHVWVRWSSIGAGTYTVYRQRFEGAWTRLGAVSGTSFLDRTTNPRGIATYRVVAGGVTCDIGPFTLATADGWGYADAVYGGIRSDGSAGSLMEQEIYSPAMATASGTAADPSYSPDGHRIAFTRFDSDTASIAVAPAARPQVRTVLATMPAGVSAADVEWSPDASRLAYTRYTFDEAGEVSGSAVHVLDLATGVDTAVPGGEGLLHPDWRTTTTLITANLRPGAGLYTIPAAGGTATAVPGTDYAGDPEVGPDGRVAFVTGDGTTYAVKWLSTTGTVKAVRTSTTEAFGQPRLTDDGSLYTVVIGLNDLPDPADNTFSIQWTKDPDERADTAIGWAVDDTVVGSSGYDVRTPRSTGTSNFAGDPNPDVLARDSSGTEWIYPLTQNPTTAMPTFRPRVKLGTGWNIYNSINAAGDINADGLGDIVARDAGGTLWRYLGTGTGKVASRQKVGTGWQGYTIVPVGDFNGDALADLVARDPSGYLWLYPGNGRGGVTPRVRIGTGWQGLTAILGAGDWDHDNDSDILARDSSGRLWLYPGTGTGGFATRRQVGSGWNTLNGFATPEQIGDTNVVLARDTGGRMIAYGSTGDGRFSSDWKAQIGSGWSGLAFTS